MRPRSEGAAGIGSSQAGEPGLPTLGRRPARYLVFFGIYLYQGLVAGFSLTALANHAAGLGLSASEVGLHFAVAGLPWTLQPILWGPLVDRAPQARMGRRRFVAACAVLGAQGSLAALFLAPGPEALGLVSAAFLLHSLFASLLDTACDRMIMDHVPDAELGRMSGCTRGGFVIGTSLSAALFSVLLDRAGFAASIACLIGASSLALLPLLLVRESEGDALLSLVLRARTLHEGASSHAMVLVRLVAGLRRRSALRLVALCFCVDFALSLFELRFNVEVVQSHGWDGAALSRFQAALGLVGGTLGAFAIGLWSDRAGPWAAVTGVLVGGAASFALAAGLIGAGLAGAGMPVVLGLTNVLPNLTIVALVPALMRESRGHPGAATRFEAFMAIMNLGAVCGGAVSGASAAVLPTGGLALLTAAALLLTATTCPGLDREPPSNGR